MGSIHALLFLQINSALSWFVNDPVVAIKHYFGGSIAAISSSCVDQGVVLIVSLSN